MKLEIIAVTGGRDYRDGNLVAATLGCHHGSMRLLIHGGASGADSLAERWATASEVPCLAIRAEWSRYGPSAGPRRNREMAAARPDLLIAFPGGAGTANCIAEFAKLGIPIWIVAPDGKVTVRE